MSVHRYESGQGHEPVVITICWDPPAERFSATIKRPGFAEVSVLPTTQAFDGERQRLDGVLARLKVMRLEVPERMVEELMGDRRENIDDKEVLYREHGGVLTRQRVR